MLGDMNIDVKVENISVNRYLDMIASKGLQNIVKSDTRVDISRGTATRIDHLLVRIKNKTVISTVIATNVADHYSLLCGIRENPNIKPKTYDVTELIIYPENEI